MSLQCRLKLVTFLISSKRRSLSSLVIAPVSPLRLGENLKAAAATPPPSIATPPAAMAATLPRAPTVAAAMVPDPGNNATDAAAVSNPVSEDLRDLLGEDDELTDTCDIDGDRWGGGSSRSLSTMTDCCVLWKKIHYKFWESFGTFQQSR